MAKRKSQPLIIGHRGSPEEAPENTLSSFRQAIELGVDTVEFDVLETKDGYLVVHHDYALGRTNNGKGFVHETLFSDIRKLDAGSWFSEKFQGEKIPMLEEVVSLCKGKCRMELELKGSNQAFMEKCLTLLYKKKVIPDVEITSPHIPLLVHIKEKEPKIRTGMFIDIYPDWMSKNLGRKLVVDNLILANADVAHLPLSIIDQELVNKLHQNNKLVHVANCNTERDIKKVLQLGIDQLSTNKPHLALKIIRNQR